MTIKPWKLKSEEVIFEKYGRQIVRQAYSLPDGNEADFYIRDGEDACAIVALTPDQKVIMVKQFRPGPSKVLLELPGGGVGKTDKDPLSAIAREFTDETGYSGHIELAGTSYIDAYSKTTQYCYIAKNCREVSKQNLESTEFAEVELITLQEFRDLLRSGQLTDVEVGYIGLDYLGLL
jgi:ADP-ribose pyrophosphatase